MPATATRTPWKIAADEVATCKGEFRAEMGNCVMNHATFGGKTMDNQNTYAQFAEVNWSNS
jgi:hypothetical protein